MYPTRRAASRPFWKTMRVGMLKMLYRIASCWFSSVLTLATLILSRCLSPKLSTTGETRRQGPHQGAQKSTRTGLSALRTSDSKVASSTVIGAVVAIVGEESLQQDERGRIAAILAPGAERPDKGPRHVTVRRLAPASAWVSGPGSAPASGRESGPAWAPASETGSAKGSARC